MATWIQYIGSRVQNMLGSLSDILFKNHTNEFKSPNSFHTSYQGEQPPFELFNILYKGNFVSKFSIFSQNSQFWNELQSPATFYKLLYALG